MDNNKYFDKLFIILININNLINIDNNKYFDKYE
jgi:hypothetical protein